MNRIKKPVASILIACVMLSFAACGGAVGGYRVIETFNSEEFAIGFRNDDYIRAYFEAAIKTLSAEGTIHSIALQWFSQDNTSFSSDAKALEKIGQLPVRSVVVGVDTDAFPMSYLDANENYTGFDVDVVRAVCSRLGWSVEFQPIKAENAYVELSSGNVDIAWGGLALEQGSKTYTVLAPYITNELVLVTRGDSTYSSKRKLSGATLAMDTEQKYMDALSAEESLTERLGQIKRIPGGAVVLFDALSTNKADAILVSNLALQYYGR